YAGTTGYRREYRVLDEFLGDDRAPEGPPPSLHDLLAAADHVPVIVVSYGGAHTRAEDLAAMVARHRDVLRVLTIPYSYLHPLASGERRTGSREHLVLATHT